MLGIATTHQQGIPPQSVPKQFRSGFVPKSHAFPITLITFPVEMAIECHRFQANLPCSGTKWNDRARFGGDRACSPSEWPANMPQIYEAPRLVRNWEASRMIHDPYAQWMEFESLHLHHIFMAQFCR